MPHAHRRSTAVFALKFAMKFATPAALAIVCLGATVAPQVVAAAAKPDAAKAAPAPAPWTREDLAAAKALRDRLAKGSEAFAFVRDLTTEVGPRSAGSAGDATAVVWAKAKLEALGFDRVYTQEVNVPHWDRGELEVRTEAPFSQRLVAVSLGGSIGTAQEGLHGEVVRFDSLEALKAAPDATVAGRIVFLDQSMMRDREGKGYSPVVRGRADGASLAGAKGATAIVIRSVGTDATVRFAHTGAVTYAINAPRIPAVALANPDADQLARQFATAIERQAPVRLFLRSTARELPMAKSANVIGEITGSELPDEVVLLGGHLDSWDLGHGAIDDGAGVAIVTAAAIGIKQAGLKPRRTVRVVLWANEEFGLSGANEYARRESANLAKHVGAVEADFGGARVFRFSSRVAATAVPALQQVQGVLAPLGIEWGNNEAGGGADTSPLRREGVPVFNLQQDGTLYFDNHHTANDTLDKVDPAAVDQAAAAYGVLVWLLAQGNLVLR